MSRQIKECHESRIEKCHEPENRKMPRMKNATNGGAEACHKRRIGSICGILPFFRLWHLFRPKRFSLTGPAAPSTAYHVGRQGRDKRSGSWIRIHGSRR